MSSASPAERLGRLGGGPGARQADLPTSRQSKSEGRSACEWVDSLISDHLKHWRAFPFLEPQQRAGEWAGWLRQQIATAGKSERDAAATGVYLSLRMDGRVRASGLGAVPWARLAAELSPWKGPLDGFDGSVSPFS